MEIRVIGRGAIAGVIAGVIGFVFARIFAEPVVDQAIAYEDGRGDILNALRKAAGLSVESEGPEIFSRTIQSTVGVATGIIGLGFAMGLIVSVVFLMLHGRVATRPRNLAWGVAGCGFLAVFLMPFAKYPANPPAIGHEFTIADRGRLYLTMVVFSIVLVAAAVFLARRLSGRMGTTRAVLVAGACALVVYGVVFALLPALGDLAANVAAGNELGFARAATETPQPITNTLGKAVAVDGVTYGPGQLVYPGFDADLLWKFRWYSLLEQVIIWGSIALVFGGLVERTLAPSTRPEQPRRVPAGAR